MNLFCLLFLVSQIFNMFSLVSRPLYRLNTGEELNQRNYLREMI